MKVSAKRRTEKIFSILIWMLEFWNFLSELTMVDAWAVCLQAFLTFFLGKPFPISLVSNEELLKFSILFLSYFKNLGWLLKLELRKTLRWIEAWRMVISSRKIISNSITSFLRLSFPYYVRHNRILKIRMPQPNHVLNLQC